MKSRVFLSVVTGSILLFSPRAANSQPPKAHLLVLDKAGDKLLFVDVDGNKVVGEVPTGHAPHEVSASADGKLAFVANYGDQTPGQSLSVIDLTAGKELHRVELGALRRPHGLWVSKGKLYFTAEVNKLVGRYDPAKDQVDWLMGTGQGLTHMLVINRDQTKIFTANIVSDSVSMLEAKGPGGWTASVIPVGKGPEAIDISPDDKEVWTAHSADGGVSVIDTATLKVVATIPSLTKHSNRLKFTPDGKIVLISDAEGNEVVVLDAKTRKEIKRLKTEKEPLGILITPDGQRAYVACESVGKLMVLNLRDLTVAGTIETGGQPDGMAWVE